MFKVKTKRFFRTLVVFAVLLCITALPVLALTGQVTTASDALNVRSGPGTNFQSVAKLQKGSTVTILEQVKADPGDTSGCPNWYKISATVSGKSVTGYAASRYITVQTETQPDPNTPPDEKIYTYPEAYRPYLKDLVAKHPNWVFTFYDTGLDWNDVMAYETASGMLGRNVVSPSSPESYRYKDPKTGKYWKSAEGWYQASDQVVAYYMDPRNSMTESSIFQFELLSYNASVHTLSGVEAILKGSFMENKRITDDSGKQITYAQAIMDAARISSASPYYLATKIIQEVSRNGSGSTSGTYVAKNGTSYKGYYNFYNIQATSSTNDPIAQGLAWAKSTDSDPNKNYGRPWTSPYKSIVGGAQWIARNYISVGQDTIYLQKFDVDSSDGKLYAHQYMTNVAGATSEAGIQYKGYVNMDMLEGSFIFSIPTYKNLPANRCRLPGDTSVDPAPIPDRTPDPDLEIDPNAGVTPGPDTKVMGDLSNDGKLTAADARMVLQSASGLRALTDAQKKKADANKDGRLTAADARMVLQAASGLRTLGNVS